MPPIADVTTRRLGRTARRRARVFAAVAYCASLCVDRQSAVALDIGGSAGPLPEIVVIGASPVPGLAIDIDKFPGNVQSVSAADIAYEGTANLTGALSSHLGSVSVSDNLADPFQPDILYRGFAASPVLGTPQGLAVYQNGVRINEAFGDSVNWDLIPDLAIDRLDIVSSSPLYGLNALGGALALTMKNGFTYRGADATLSGGSFDQRSAAAEFGTHGDLLGIYAAARVLDEGGWRQFAHDAVRQYYVDATLHGKSTTLDLSYSRANNQLFGPGAAPVQSLAIDRSAVFTGPQANINRVDFLTLDAAHTLTHALAVQGVGYVRHYRQSVSNGNSTNFIPCTAAAESGVLCQSNGITPLVTVSGESLPDISNGGARIIGQNNFESIDSPAWGASVQLTDSSHWHAHDNLLAVGATLDTAHSNFETGTEVGVINPALIVEPSTLIVDTPEGAGFSATPVLLKADTRYYGAYLTDTVDATDVLSLTVSARYNVAKIDLADRRGTDLTGRDRYTHFNPAWGATYKISTTVTVFAGFSVNNRAPTPSEIECSDPARPCLLPSSLAGDPPSLRQVVARSAELGLRGRSSTEPFAPTSWNASAFRTDADDDIYGVATSVSSGFFRNIGATRRQGLETGVTYQLSSCSAYGEYSYIDATFRTALTLRSPSNPFHDANGDIKVLPGDRLPGIPRHRLKAGADCGLTANWSFGMSAARVSDQTYHGDESNQNPALAGYTVWSLRSTLRLAPHVELFASVHNLFAAHYAGYGLYSDPTGVNAPGIPPDAATDDPRVDNRFQNPAAPRSAFGGIRVSF